ncbi:MAG: superoxide dismutase [Actinobacteria bacterium]|jgi:Fe-Mn family superoxide dismutase|uniref:superoxide dismutase n=1 Tax=freshwater metagenome TaxID=449393 RepID=A0A6J6NUP1_9ZZZZ|nr:superoxide dismutase [Actinomycetota bacterium]
MSKYVLPDLSYDYGALEPNISGRIMELHHDKHHLAYVNGANAALDALAEAREKNDLSMVNKFQKDLAFNLAGHVNHAVFWKNMSPEGGDKPTGELAAAIDEFFGSFDAFRAHFTASALGIQGSGWSILVWDILGQKLIIEQLYDHQGNLAVGSIPLLMLDMWEHAFYLDYQNVKPEYVKAFWNIVNWADVQARFAEASQNTANLLLP